MRPLAISLAIRLAPAVALGQYSDKVATTPVLIQDGFGYGGGKLPGDGLEY